MKIWITECDEWDHAYANQTRKGALNGIIEYLEMEINSYEEYEGRTTSVTQGVDNAIKEIKEAMDSDVPYLSFYSPFGNFYVTKTELGD